MGTAPGRMPTFPAVSRSPRIFLRLPWLPQTLLLLVAIAGILSGRLNATDTASEYEIKATFLFNFARFIEWPDNVLPSDGQPIIIGIVGDDPFGGVLDAMVKGETVNGHKLVVKRLSRKDDFQKCHIVYISRSETAHIAEILERLKGLSVLTVSDADRFAYLGGTIGLVNEQGRVRMQINVDRAKNSQLAISAKLLRPAAVIRDQPQSRVLPVRDGLRTHYVLISRSGFSASRGQRG